MAGDPEFGSSARLAACLVDDHCPVGLPLIAMFKKGFAYKTIGHRLPVILTKVIDQLSQDKNEIGSRLGKEARDEVKEVVGALAKLKNEMQTNKSIPKVNCPQWNSYLELIATRYFSQKVEDVRWYLAPWLYVECYMYQRIHEAFASTKWLKEFDVFQKQKEAGWFESVDAAAVLADFVKSNGGEKTKNDDELLKEMLEISLWGNRCDLSISQGENNSQTQNIVEQLHDLKGSILCDDSPQFWDYFRNQTKVREENPGRGISVGYVLDNAGFELFTDLCFADVLMRKVDKIDFYAKVLPWFVSDALRKDVVWLVETLKKATNTPVLQEFGERWATYLDTKRWNVIEHPFWTYPHAFYEMPSAAPDLHSTLQQHTTLIFKGDLNYRKLIGDVNWLPTTSFKDSLQGFCPVPLVALRTLKADCVSGLKKGVAEEMEKKDPDWMVTGEFGVIQFCK